MPVARLRHGVTACLRSFERCQIDNQIAGLSWCGDVGSPEMSALWLKAIGEATARREALISLP